MSDLVAIGLLLCGCGSGALSAVRGQAVKDMTCPAQSLTISPSSPPAGQPTESGVYYAEGCKQLRRYSVFCNIAGYCPDPSGLDILGMVQRQAGFDLKCDQSAVEVQRLNADTFGAIGCDRRASYVLLCPRGGCKLVQNTQSQ
jgi:hypothetical protein